MIILKILAILCAVFGVVGSIVPGLPGPPVSWVGLLILFFARCASVPMTTAFLLIWLAVTVMVTVLDYMAPIWTTRMTGGHKAASTGAILGLVAGMILPPVGMIVGSLVGAFVGELMVTDKGAWAAFKAGIGAFLGFMCGTGLKLISSGVMAYHIVRYAFFL